MSYVLLLFAVLLFVLLIGFFVAAELAIVLSRRWKLVELAVVGQRVSALAAVDNPVRSGP